MKHSGISFLLRYLPQQVPARNTGELMFPQPYWQDDLVGDAAKATGWIPTWWPR